MSMVLPSHTREIEVMEERSQIKDDDLALLKKHLRVETDEDDDLIKIFWKAGIRTVESMLGRRLDDVKYEQAFFVPERGNDILFPPMLFLNVAPIAKEMEIKVKSGGAFDLENSSRSSNLPASIAIIPFS